MKQRGTTTQHWLSAMVLRSVAAVATSSTLACGVSVMALTVGSGVSAQAAERGDAALDTIILNSGRIITGHVLKETDDSVLVEVVLAGIKAQRTYQKSDILEIKRASHTNEMGHDIQASTAPMHTPSTPTAEPKAKPSASTEEADDNTAKIYMVNLKGRWAIDVSETPLKKLFEEVDSTFGDLVPGTGMESGRLVVDPEMRRKHIVVLKIDMSSAPGFNTIFRAEEISPIVMDEIVKKGRRVVFWVEQAAGGAAFLPWVSNEIFFTPDGQLSGMAELDAFSSGDTMVDEKLIGAFFGAAEGFAIKGGYADQLDVIHAMIRKQNWLWVRFDGGKPVYSTAAKKDSKSGNRNMKEDAPDGPDPKYTWTLLSDNGEGDYKDESSFEGNDVFSLNAEWGEKLGISDGTAETEDDLAFGLGVQRNYVVLDSSAGQKIFDQWKKRLNAAFAKVNRDSSNSLPLGSLWREYGEIQVQGSFNDRKKARGRQISLLRKVRGYLSKFAEVLDPDGKKRAQVDLMISQHKLEAEDDSRSQRRRGGR